MTTDGTTASSRGAQDEPPRGADGKALAAAVRPLGVATEPIIQPHTLFGVPGVCGFSTDAATPGKAGLELTVGSAEPVAFWLDGAPVMSA